MDSSTKQFVEVGKAIGLKGDELRQYIESKGEEERIRLLEERDYEEKKEKERRKFELELLEKKTRILELEKKNINVKPKIHPISNNDNIDSYLFRFEVVMKQCGIEKEHWSIQLAALLTGESLAVMEGLGEEACDYEILKSTLCKRFRLDQDGYKRKFEQIKMDEGEDWRSFFVRFWHYQTKWLEMAGVREGDYQALRLLLAKDRLGKNLNSQINEYLSEKDPKNYDEIIQIGENYFKTYPGRRVNKEKYVASAMVQGNGSHRALGQKQRFKDTRQDVNQTQRKEVVESRVPNYGNNRGGNINMRGNTRNNRNRPFYHNRGNFQNVNNRVGIMECTYCF